MCNLSDPEYCLKTLTERSLLEEYRHTDELRYQFHRLIAEFLQYVQTEYSDVHRIQSKIAFNLNYQLYYSQVILSLSQIYSGSPDSNEIVSRLEHDKHNFLIIFQKMVEQQLDIKSTLKIAYSFTNSSDVVIELLNCDDCFVEILQALIVIFDQKILEISREVGLSETTIPVLYFNLIHNAKKTLIFSKLSTESCMAVCNLTFATHYSRVEKLSAAHSNAFYYLPLLCDLDCFYGPDMSFAQVAIMMLVPVSLVIMKAIRLSGVIKNQCTITIVSVLGFITIVVIIIRLVIPLYSHTVAPFLPNIYIYKTSYRKSISQKCKNM